MTAANSAADRCQTVETADSATNAELVSTPTRALDAEPVPTTLADLLAELKKIRHALGLSQALAVGEKDLARLLGISPATLARWKASGRLLPGIRQGGRILYVLDGPKGVRAWLAAGMPDVKTWKAMKPGE